MRATVSRPKALWHLRESIPLAEAELGKSVKHDVSIPISSIAGFVHKTNALLQARFPGVRHVIFGHLGDGNLHYNVANAPGQTESELLALQSEIYGVVHDSVHAHSGSISAEHGVGQLKRDELPRYKSAVELALMRRIKRALDPQGLMNPGKGASSMAVSPAAGANNRILIVEDDHIIAGNLYTFLEARGFLPDAAYTGHAALERMKEQRFDAVILDIGLPGMDGNAVLHALRNDMRVSVPVLMLTARDSLEDKLAGFSHGADDYLTKPFALLEVEARLLALIQRAKGSTVDTVRQPA
ncbi:hypothetical protein G6F35_011888 [Rhizopus arrhizus]|nr:hypothetical protein G6F35_011888 [Rhizopus arrhizus]